MYESFYGLQGKPFQLSPNPELFFGSSGHRRALSYLRYGLKQGEGFIVITGDVGTGKTTLVKTLFAELSRENIIAAQLVSTQLDADDLLKMTAAAYGLAYEGVSKATLLRNMETFLIARAREGKRVLLVVDEAQNLPPASLEELRMLSNFQLAGRALLQSFLLGQEEFRKTLQEEGMEQLRQRIIAAYHLNPLDKEETKSYIFHRLQRMGWCDDPQFTDDCLELIFRHTGGVPRRINTLCDRLMLFGYLEERHRFDGTVVEAVVNELAGEVPGPAGGRPTAVVNPLRGVQEVRLEDLTLRVEALERRIKALEALLKKRSMWYALTGNR